MKLKKSSELFLICIRIQKPQTNFCILEKNTTSSYYAISQFLDLLYAKDVFPLITRPIRITAHNASLIDNTSTNNLFARAISGPFSFDISYH